MKSPLPELKWTFKSLNLASPKVMGILNLTPDSFFDGGKYNSIDLALQQFEDMVRQGAAIIDIGAFSTRPFAQTVNESGEWDRLKSILPMLRKTFPDTHISLDTYRSKIAEKAIDGGVDMINDISGGVFDDKMFDIIAKYKVPFIMMHINGNPQTMQQNPVYENVVDEVGKFLEGQIEKLAKYGVNENIILDPGFGFGKTVDHNYLLLGGLQKLKKHGYPVLAGLSRKSMINKVIGIKPEEALNGTSAINMLALINGADILRVHDVKEAVEVVKLYEKYRENNPG